MSPPHPGDLTLAEAARRGEPEAVRRITTELLDEAARAVTRINPSADFIEEVKQVLRERLLVSTEGRPTKLAEYTGYTLALGRARLTLARVLQASGREPERARTLAEAARATGAQWDSVSHQSLRAEADAVLAKGTHRSVLTVP